MDTVAESSEQRPRSDERTPAPTIFSNPTLAPFETWDAGSICSDDLHPLLGSVPIHSILASCAPAMARFVSRGTNARIRLGPLERAVMTALWAADQGGDVVSVHAAVGTPRAITRNTIHSTLERLIRKGLVVRQRRGRAYHYAARVSQSAWIAEVLDEVTAQLGAEDRHVVLAGFVDFAVRTGEDTLATLEAMLRDHRRRGDGGDE